MDGASHDHGSDGASHDGPGTEQGHSRGSHAASRRALVVSLVINTVFFLVVLAGALLAGSVTLLAEAVHMLTDSLGLLLALVAAWLASRAADARRTFGYHRFEVVGGLANGLLLLGAVGYILLEAVRRFRDPPPVDASVIILVGAVGLVANLAAAWVLFGHRDSLNVEGAFLHLVADAAGSVAAVALGVTLLFTDLYVLDPVFALLIAALVLYSVKDLLVDGLNVLLQGTPRSVDTDELAGAFCEIPGVVGTHDVHVWALDSNRTVLSAHVTVSPEVDRDAVLERTRRRAREFGVNHATIQIESPEFSETRELNCHRPED